MMPEPRATRGRNFTAGPAVQFDPTTDHENGYRRNRRTRSKLIAGDGFRAPRRTKAGWAVEPRNGIPFRPYRVPGLHFPGCGCIYHVTETRRTLAVACQHHEMEHADV